MNNEAPKNSQQIQEISLKDLILKTGAWFKYLSTKKLFIIAACVLGVILGFVYSLLKKPVYTAVNSFVIEESGGGGAAAGLGQYAGIASMVGLDLGGGGGIFQGDNLLELYKSRRMIQKALLSDVDINNKKELLINRYIAFNKLHNKWKEEGLGDVSFEGNKPFTRLQDSLIGTIVFKINQDYLNVSKPDKKLSIINVKVTAKDELFAKLFNDEVVATVNEFYVQSKTKKSLENVTILQNQTDSVRNVLNGAIFSGAAVSDATPNLNPTRQILRAPIQRSQLNAEANKAMLAQLLQNLELSKISLRKETPLIQIIDNSVFPLDKVEIKSGKAMFIGGFLGVLLMVIALSLRRLFKSVLAE